MAHGITDKDSMFSANRQMPWHGLGVLLYDYPRSLDEALDKSGLGWGVTTAPVLVEHRAAWKDVANAHDGSMAVTAAVTPIRIVCANTLGYALSRAEGA